MSWNRIGNDLDRLNVKFQLHSLELQNKLQRQQQSMNMQPQMDIKEVIDRMKKAKVKGSPGTKKQSWKSAWDLVDDEPEEIAPEEYEYAEDQVMEALEENWISEESGEDIAQQAAEAIRRKKKKAKSGKNRSSEAQNAAAGKQKKTSGQEQAGSDSGPIQSGMQRNQKQTHDGCRGICSGSINTEELRQAMLWSEILGEPVSRRRRKRRMNG